MIRAPEQPMGWPSAMAPPLTFNFSIGTSSRRGEEDAVDREGLVVLEEVEVPYRFALPLQELLNRRNRRLGESIRLTGCPGRPGDPRNRLQAMLRDGPLRSQDQGGGTVGDLTGVARGKAAIGPERRS